jgi:hypothetical protein
MLNTAQISAPLTDSDVSAAVTALNNPTTSNAAKIAMLKMVFTAASQMDALDISSSDVFSALAAGAPRFSDRSLFEALALETNLTSSWGALVIQGAGVIQVITWAKSAPTWIAAQLSSLETVLTDTLTGNLKGAASTFLSVFGIGKTVQKDTSNVHQMFQIMATSNAPGFAACLNMLQGPALKITGSGPGGKSSSSSGSSDSSSSGSASGSNSASRDSSAIGIQSRRSLSNAKRK